MDLKCGNGAFMDNIEDARRLAHSIVSVANEAGTQTSAILTDMNQVLGHNVGNALEVIEAVEYLKGEKVDARLHQITLELCAELLVNAQLSKDLVSAKKQLQKVLDSGKALEIFAKMVAALGGPTDFCERPLHYLPRAAIVRPVYPENPGYVTAMNTRDIGLSIIELKGGRVRPDQKLDYATGYSRFCQIGDLVDDSTPLAVVHAQTEDEYKHAAAALRKHIKVSAAHPLAHNSIIEKIS